MKKLNLILFVLVLAFVACQQPQIAAPPKPIDFDAAKKEVTSVLDTYHGAMKAKNASQMADLFAEDGLYCGTDPNELWDKEAFSDYIRQAFADTAMQSAATMRDGGMTRKKELQSERRTGRRSYSFSPEIVHGSRCNVVDGDSPKIMR